MSPPDRHAGWSLVIHGGAGQMRRETLRAETERATRAGLQAALAAGADVLALGGAALDAVEAAVRVLEDDPAFNAGRGAALTGEGVAELDAAIMAGADRRAGAVAAVRGTRHPVSLARAVMERSPHVLLSGAGADRFSAEQGLEQVAQDWLATPERRRQLAELLARPDGAGFDAEMKYGTVGAVARDAAGRLAAATSTGGVTGKRWGRIGDSPLIGAGTYADDRAGAVSATGAGEFFIRAGAAHEICARVRLAGADIARAAGAVIDDVRALGGTGGVIFVGSDGTPGWRFSTAGMNRGMVSADRAARVAIFADEG